jgi:AcrR family transcriptional regulator
MADDVNGQSNGTAEPADPAKKTTDPRTAIVEALLELAGERSWEDINISDIAQRANVTLSTFRDYFPSKGAVLAGFARKIDKEVLDGTTQDLVGEPAKERLFDVLMRRLDALAPYKLGVEGIVEWARRDPMAAAALDRLEVNSMRFMLEAAGIDSEGPVGVLKLQGLVFAWLRVLRVWFRDDDPALAATMAELDRALTRGGKFVARAEDLNRLAAPLYSIARAFFERRRPPPSYSQHDDRPAT